MSTLQLDLGNFTRRLLQDAMSEASAKYWRQRARTLEQALSRPGDYQGQATPEQVAERDERLRAAILACSLRAQLYELDADVSEEVDAALAEVGI